MIAAGVEAHLVAVDLKKLPASFAGRRFDAALLERLPAGADPCGENGEFHTFVSAGPMLKRQDRGHSRRDGRARRLCVLRDICLSRAA